MNRNVLGKRSPVRKPGLKLVIADLLALREAPVAEPYAGPAIIEGRAAGVFFHEMFGHRMEGHRQKAEDSSQTFAKKLGKEVRAEIRDAVEFRRFNLLEPMDVLGTFDLVLMRNVMLYFSSEVKRGVLRRVLHVLRPDASFATGASAPCAPPP